MSDAPRVLFLSYAQPFAPFIGFAYRTVSVLKWLSENSSVDVVFQGSPDEANRTFIPLDHFHTVNCVPDRRPLMTRLRAMVGRLPYHHALFSNRAMERVVRRLLHRISYDLIWLNKTVHLPTLDRVMNCPPIVVDQHAAEPTVWDNLIRADPRPHVRQFARWNRWRDLRYERIAYSRVAGVIAISPLDEKITRTYFPNARVTCITQGIDVNHYAPVPGATANPDRLLFSGTGVPRNLEAMKWFVQRVMPLVRARRPTMSLLWIGNVERTRHRFLQQPGIETTGFIPEVPPFFARGAIYVSPFHMGEGMKTKIVEALAMGKVVVTTPVGAIGVNTNGLPFIKIGNSAEELARAILEYRADPGLPELGNQARQHAVEHYALDVLNARLRLFLQAVLAGKDILDV